MTINELVSRYGALGFHPDHPIGTWKEDVAKNRTRLGYWAWVAKQLDPEG